MAKDGFGGQWIEIFKVGDHLDSCGNLQKINADFIDRVVANFNADAHEPPLVVGHPKENAPAFGWAKELRKNGDSLEAKFGDTDDEFERLVAERKYPKRSASFYLNPPMLRHVGFLGAQPPALKGLREIQFNDGDRTAVEISFNFNEENLMSEKNEPATEEKKTFTEWMKEMFGGGGQQQQPAPAASFSEADKKQLIAEAVKQAREEVTAEFSEKITALDTTNKALREDLDSQSASGKRAEIISFVEAIPAANGKHFLKRAGVVEFLEACANADAANKGAEVVSFSEGDVEHKYTLLGWAKDLLSALPPMVSFGESFGNIKATAEADTMVNAGDLDELRAGMGVKAETGGAK